MNEKSNFPNRQFSPFGFKGDLALTEPEDFKTYNEFVEAKIKELPDHLIMLLPTEGGEETLHAVQIIWINEFWRSRKKLSV